MSIFSWVSVILSFVCLAWCVGLGFFVLVKVIINKIKAKQEIKQHMSEHENQKKGWFGHDKGTKKGK